MTNIHIENYNNTLFIARSGIHYETGQTEQEAIKKIETQIKRDEYNRQVLKLDKKD